MQTKHAESPKLKGASDRKPINSTNLGALRFGPDATNMWESASRPEQSSTHAPPPPPGVWPHREIMRGKHLPTHLFRVYSCAHTHSRRHSDVP